MIEVEYTAQMRAADVAIARATGWRVVPQSDHRWKLVSPDGDEYLHYPDSECPWDDVPLYHADRDGLADALQWASLQDYDFMRRFLFKLHGGFLNRAAFNIGDTMRMLTAPPHVIAAALAQAIEQEGKQ